MVLIWISKEAAICWARVSQCSRVPHYVSGSDILLVAVHTPTSAKGHPEVRYSDEHCCSLWAAIHCGAWLDVFGSFFFVLFQWIPLDPSLRHFQPAGVDGFSGIYFVTSQGVDIDMEFSPWGWNRTKMVVLNWYSFSTFAQTVSGSSVQDNDEERPKSYKGENVI